MPIEKGISGNYLGRPKGSSNKTSLETKKLISLFMNKKFKEIEKTWDSLEPLDKVKTYISLVKYVMPVLASVKVEDSKQRRCIEKIPCESKIVYYLHKV